MTQLFEILAVEPDLKKTTAEKLKGTIALFGQPGKFTGQAISFHTLLESEPELQPEVTQMAFKVDEELDKIAEIFGGYMDVTVQKEVTNTTAFGDVVVGDVKFLEGLSATALLNLEGRLEELRKVYEAIPVLDSTEKWAYDGGRGYYVSERRQSYRTKKTLRNHVKAAATKEHPAQVDVYTEDIPAYRVEKEFESGMLPPREKTLMLERLDKLALVVKQARQRANTVIIKPVKVAKKIFDYINNG